MHPASLTVRKQFGLTLLATVAPIRAQQMTKKTVSSSLPEHPFEAFKDHDRLKELTGEQLIELVSQFTAQIREIDQLATTVLKAHFDVERHLDSVLKAVAKNPNYLKS